MLPQCYNCLTWFSDDELRLNSSLYQMRVSDLGFFGVWRRLKETRFIAFMSIKMATNRHARWSWCYLWNDLLTTIHPVHTAGWHCLTSRKGFVRWFFHSLYSTCIWACSFVNVSQIISISFLSIYSFLVLDYHLCFSC